MSDILYENEGKHLDTIRWPFKRYQILLPEKNNVDAFAWLVASFVRMYNRKKKNPEFLYNDDIENVVKSQIRQYFGNIIDVPTLEKVIETTKAKYLDPSHHDSIKVFNNLFTNNLQTRFIFQDCLTGSVVPYFYDEIEVESDLPRDKNHEGGLKPVRTGKPAKKYVRLAYKRYFNRERYLTDDPEEVLQELYKEDELLEDENNQVFEDEGEFTIVTEEESEDSLKHDRRPGKFDIKFLDNGTLVYYDVPISVENNKLFVKTPFDYSTSPWMNICFEKGSKENGELKNYADRYTKFLTPAQKIEQFFENKNDSIYLKLPNCAEIFRSIEDLGDRRMKEYVWRIEDDYVRRNPDFYLNCTKLLERLLKRATYTESDPALRAWATKEYVDKRLDEKCAGIDCTCLKYPSTFIKWKQKYENKNNRFIEGSNQKREYKPVFDFKGEFLDLMLQSDISKSPLMKRDSVNNIWYLWNNRNKQGHDDESMYGIKVTKKSLEMMTDSVKLLCQMIKRGA